MRYGLSMPPFGPYSDPRYLAQIARGAEEAGWDGFFIWDHVAYSDPAHPFVDPWIALAAIAMIILAPIAAMLIQMAISRKREYNADSFGAELAGDPMYLATALEKLHLQNRRLPMKVPMDSQKSMFIVQPFSGKDAADWFNTHPNLKKRLMALIGRETTGRF